MRYAGSNLVEFAIQNKVKHSLQHNMKIFWYKKSVLELLKEIVDGENC